MEGSGRQVTIRSAIEFARLRSSDAGDNPDSRVRFMVARKRKLTPEILDVLAGDPNDGVTASVARHHRTLQNIP